MEIILAENAGFCFGVDRAVKMTENELSQGDSNVYSYGPLIHNPQAVKALEDKGLETVDGFGDISDGRIIVRSHGVPQDIINEIEESGLHLVDCTCPYVKAVHRKVQEYNSKGYSIVIIGDRNHPEVIGINGWCGNSAFIINDLDDAKELPEMERACVVSQTTNRLDKFLELSRIVDEKSKETILFNTICNATKLRQEAAEKVAKKVDAMIVIGGKHSSNTIKLAEISSRHCKNVFHIETIEELALQRLQNFNTIGITAGASTPDWIIKEAINKMDS